MKSTSDLRKFLAGFSSSPFFMYIAILLPWTINALFQAGLKNAPLYVAASAIPLAFVSLVLVRLKPAARDVAHLIASICASILAGIAGLIANFGVDKESIPGVIVLVLFLLAGFIATYLDVLGKNDMALRGNTSMRLPRLWLQGFGFALPVIMMGIAREIFQQDGWLFYIAGGMFVLAPVAKIFGTNRATQNEEVVAPASSPSSPAIKAILAVLVLALFFSMFMFSLIINIDAANRALPGYLGIAAGVVIAFVAGKKAWLARSAVLPGILVLYAILSIAPLLAVHAWFVGLAGVLPGLVIGEIALHAYLLPRSPKKSSEGLYLFALLLVTILPAAFAPSFQYFNTGSMIVPLISFVAIFIIAISIATSQGARTLLRAPIERVSAPGKPVSARRKTLVAGVVLATIVIGPLLATGVYMNSYTTVHVNFDQTLYDVNGNPVTSVDLSPMTAKILFYTPNPANGTPHGELIRPGISVRLGGYYYGYHDTGGTFTKSDVVDWIGHNNDVFSLSLCGMQNDTITSSDILAIKTMNSRAKFYYMSFATTLFEDPGSNSTGPAWGNAHYATVGFNATINSFTLKLANGSEALGVRRDSITSTAHLMDLGNPGWAKYFAWIYENRCVQFHANGVAIDEIMWGNYWNVDTWNHGVLLRDYTSQAQITATCYEWLQRIRGNMSVEIINQASWPEAQHYLNGVWGEIAFKSPGGQYGDPVNGVAWQQDVQLANETGSKNESYIWAAWYQQNNAASLEYAIGTYMMAKPNGCASLVFHPQPVYNGGYPANLAGYAVETVKNEVQNWPQYFNIQLGDALGQMRLKSSSGGHYYERDFHDGIVLVNPFHAHITCF